MIDEKLEKRIRKLEKSINRIIIEDAIVTIAFLIMFVIAVI